MLWLTWRQHRKQALFAVIGLAVLAAILIPTGFQMYDALDTSGLSACVNALGTAEFVSADELNRCKDAGEVFRGDYESRTIVAALLVFLPLLVGMFWGGTLVAREVEQGTHRLVWTQGVSRLRWLLVKGGLVGGAAVILAVIYALLVSWWTEPLVTGVQSPFLFPMFDIGGFAPVGYTIFAVALGIFAGSISRKVLAAMAITLVGFVVARVGVTLFRPSFQAPVEARFAANSENLPNDLRGDWVLSEKLYDAAGTFRSKGLMRCPDGLPPDTPADEQQLCETGYNVLTYQPWDRFWTFQYIETAIFVGLAVVLVVLAAYQVRRRVT